MKLYGSMPSTFVSFDMWLTGAHEHAAFLKQMLFEADGLSPICWLACLICRNPRLKSVKHTQINSALTWRILVRSQTVSRYRDCS